MNDGKHGPLGISDAQLDQLLDTVEDIAPSPSLLRAVAEIPARHPAPERAFGWGWLRAALAFGGLAAGVMGVVVGVTTSEPTAFDSVGDSDDLSTLALGVDLSEELAP